MSIRVAKMKTDYAENPLGVDNPHPKLSWVLEAAERAQVQTAFQVLVASTAELLDNDIGDLWNSGKVLSDQSVHVAYSGHQLESDTQYYWKVRVWDKKGEVSEWSKKAYWSMGLLQADDWKGTWIGLAERGSGELLPSRYLRKEFSIEKEVRRATVYASAIGIYILYLNGKRVGDHYFSPGWTDYDTRVQYQTYDVTKMIGSGKQAIGAILGTGWYCGHVGMLGTGRYGDHPYLLVQLMIEYTDGTQERIVTDRSWRTTVGPIVYSDLIMGEKFDARLELAGWDQACYDDSAWEEPVVLENYTGKLTAQVDPPVRVTEELLPVSVAKSIHGTYIFDMGQNMVGWVRLQVQGQEGQEVTVRYAEMLGSDGTLYTENLREARQEEIYVLKGDVVERFEPHFTFHGFRYVEVIGLKEVPTLNSIIGKVVHSDTPLTGKFETSDVMINKLHRNIIWGQRGNFLSVPTDCPQRNERLGWTGDAQIFARTACFNAEVARFFRKYTIDMIDAQLPSGAFTDVAPDGGWIEFKTTSSRLQWLAPDNAGWGDAGVIIPWTVYQVYGDRSILKYSYPSMVKWVEYLRANSNNLIRPDYSNYGDWLSIYAETPKDVLATAYFAYSTYLVSETARVLGNSEDVRKYAQLFDDIKRAFRRAYVDADVRIKGDTQTVYVLALQFRLLDESQRSQAISHLVNNIKGNDNHLTTGFLGVGYLLPALTSHGEIDLAYTLLTQNTFPSWLYSIRHGATTIWERWDGWTDYNGFQTPTMNSFNHYSLGSVGEWMYSKIIGIDTDKQRAGFKHILIEPNPGGGLSFARGEFESMYGTIRTEWKLENHTFILQVHVPVNTTASVTVPGNQAELSDGGNGLKEQIAYENKTVFEVGSGTYEFTSKFA